MLSVTDLSALGDLELVARAVVQGAVAGLHRSPFHGYSAEFSQYRAYRPGDDLKYVDWKLFARSDRFFTKQYRETTNTPVLVAIDVSGSMDFGAPVSKARYAQMLAAAVAFVVSRQGDAVGLVALGEAPQVLVPPRPGALQLTRVLGALERIEFEGGMELAAGLRRAHDLLPSRGLLVLISDLYDADAAAIHELRRGVRGGHDVSAFHVIAPEERLPPFEAGAEVEDLETGVLRPVSPGTLAGYRERFNGFVGRTRDVLVRDGIDYTQVSTDAALAPALRRYLLRRGG